VGDPVPPGLPAALRDLAQATDALAVRIGATEDDPQVSFPALQAVAAASNLAPTGHNMSLSVLVAYTQATAADLLRALGIDRDPAHEKVAEVAGARWHQHAVPAVGTASGSRGDGGADR
jgi:hypothetical protein